MLASQANNCHHYTTNQSATCNEHHRETNIDIFIELLGVLVIMVATFMLFFILFTPALTVAIFVLFYIIFTQAVTVPAVSANELPMTGHGATHAALIILIPTRLFMVSIMAFFTPMLMFPTMAILI